MLRTLGIFVGQRFRLSVSLPLALVLCGASVARPEGSCLILALCIWLILFCARAADDIADLPVDLQRRPGRALPAGKITARDLGLVTALGFGAALLLLAGRSPAAAIALVALSLCLVWFYTVRARLPRALHPPLVNATFLVVMLLGPLERTDSPVQSVLLAGFVWMSVVGHDFSHSVGEAPGHLGRAVLSPRAQACWGLAYFAGASMAGGLFAFHARDPYFAFVLVATSVWIAVLLKGLLRNPSEAAAKRIYIAGFLYFLLPLMARIATKWLS